MQKRNPLQVDRFHRVNKLMNDQKMVQPDARKDFISRVLQEKKLLSECTADELGILLIALGEDPSEGQVTAAC